MGRASPELMDLLHGLVVQSVVEEIKRAAAAKDEDGNPLPINPQLLDKALKLLKDNAITAPASNEPVNDLASTLRDLDLDDEAARIVRH